ncbi:nitrile hydratase accessory protein [Stappia indica]|uniref:nitrile hydratase accessory protein n=1 Tax=Stappia indica TaxID=538381 RepID=UPI001D17E139|nr:nitrile hydratase accessory protein [Stappia indica]MCC4245473.1 nitrile hydratase accessory protein [Stappia indica]
MKPFETTAGASPLPPLENLPQHGGEPVFREPWEARAFALAVELNGRGVFTWTEWAETLSQAIRDAQSRGDPDCGDNYYEHWLVALETMITRKALTSAERIDARQDAWLRAAAATPHGEAIELGRDGMPVPPA